MAEPRLYRLVQRCVLTALRVSMRLEVDGLHHIPLEGAVVIAPNHLHALDAVVIPAVVPRRLTVLAADKWRNTVAGLLMNLAANAIYVARGEADRQALARALAAAKAGQVLAVAPEGTRSRTGGLLPGKNGPIYLASRSGAPVIPLAVWGQERALGEWRRLRRPAVHVRIGEPIRLPPEAARARSDELDGYTDQLMLALARMLPPEYRGAYRDRLTASDPITTVSSMPSALPVTNDLGQYTPLADR
jgi:1-acyl-sn-glycerol-3-phosphate acyltransferase